MTLSLRLLGGFSVWDDAGREVSLPTRKTCALLAYLAVNADRPQPREALVALFWGDRGERQARRSLNQALVSIRKLANGNGGSFLDSDVEQVTLHSSAIDVDVVRFRSLLKEDPAGAAALYEGPFLDGLTVPGSDFESWATKIRIELEAMTCDALQRVAESANADGDTAGAIAAARRLVALDPLREDAHRLLMRLLYESGDRVGALRQYQACEDILRSNLQVAPGVETRKLFQEIRRDATERGTPAAVFEGDRAPVAGENRPTSRRWLVPAIVAGVLLIGGAGIAAWFVPRTPPVGTAAQVCPSLEHKPFVAVRPFRNLSGDPTQTYLSAGITEDILTRLARRSDMGVSLRTAPFRYDGRVVTVRQGAREQRIDYVLEGSIKRAGDHIRINAQLREAATGRHIWVERYDRETRDLFTMEDEIAHNVAVELAVHLTEGEVARIKFKSTNNFVAYDYFQRGMNLFAQWRSAPQEQARVLFEKAIEHDPQYARAIAQLGWVYLARRSLPGDDNDPEKSLQRAEELAVRALAIDQESSTAHALLGWLYAFKGQYELAITEGKQAIAIEPSNPLFYNRLARIMLYAGRPEEATTLVERAKCLSPYTPMQVLSTESHAHYLSGRYDRTIAACRRLLARTTTTGSGEACRRRIIASYVALGNEAEARLEAEIFLEEWQNRYGRSFSLKGREKVLRSRPYRDPSWIGPHIARLRQAGIPD